MKYQDFSSDENLLSSEDTICILHMGRYLGYISWLLQSHPTGKEPSQHLAIGVYIINRILHAGAWIRILSSSVQLDIPRVSAANASEISS